MSQADSTNTTDPSADATLTYIGAQLARWRRENIAWNAGALFDAARFPGFFEHSSDTAARQVMAETAIVWG